MGSIILSVIGAVLGSIWNRLFPPKTAAEQKAEDLQATVDEARDAVKISDQVSRESGNDLDADLAKRVRDQNQ